jgi:ribonuclease D
VAEVAARGQSWTGLLPRRFPSVQHTALQATVERALESPEDTWPRHRRLPGIRLTAAQRNRHLHLQERRDRKASELGLEPSLIASRATLVELAGGKLDPQTDLLSWQQELLGLGA